MTIKQTQDLPMTAFVQDFNTIRQQANVPQYTRFRFILKNFKPDTPVEVLDLSVRAENSLTRHNIMTFAQLNHCNLSKIRGCGKGTIKEIRTKFLSYHYDKMDDAQRVRFWKDTYEATAEMHRVEIPASD